MADKPHLRNLTGLRVGGVPLRYYRPRDEGELLEALAQCRREKLAWRVLGGGTNLLVDEGPLPYAVIHVYSPGFGEIARTGEATVRVGAGALTSALLAFCRAQGLGGLEFLAGLPGTVGGAVCGNAGAWGRQVGERVERVRAVLPDGQRRMLQRRELRFAYRGSNLQEMVVTQVELALEQREPALVARRMAEYARRRGEGQPAGAASAGCMFRNPPGRSAGRMLDLCGLKGTRVGGAVVSEQHANFVLNVEGATARDIIELIERMKREVRDRFGVELELEVRRWRKRPKVA